MIKIKTKKFKRERDSNIIALDYLKISGEKSLLELKENNQYLWEKFQEELNYAANIKIIKKNEKGELNGN